MEDPTPSPAAPPAKSRSELFETFWFFIRLAAIVLFVRSFVVTPFNIPSESMLPRLYIGDYLFVSKWNYGYSRYSLPLNLPLIPGKILARLPERGDVAVFKAPPGNRADYIKRVIGLPGDTIQMRDGQLILNGVAVPKVPMADFLIPQTANYHCPPEFLEQIAKGQAICRYRQFRETLPNGRSYAVLDRGTTLADNTQLFTVPAGHVFMMGDNRDDSADSRFTQIEGQGIGYVPVANLEGKAMVMFFSTDGEASFWPWTWFSATRWNRIGGGF